LCVCVCVLVCVCVICVLCVLCVCGVGGSGGLRMLRRASQTLGILRRAHALGPLAYRPISPFPTGLQKCQSECRLYDAKTLQSWTECLHGDGLMDVGAGWTLLAAHHREYDGIYRIAHAHDWQTHPHWTREGKNVDRRIYADIYSIVDHE